MTERQSATWQRMVEQARADAAYYQQQPERNSHLGQRFRDRRIEECEAILAIDALIRKERA